MKKNDFLLIGGILLLAIGAYFIIEYHLKNEGNIVLVKINGEECARFSLHDTIEYKLPVEDGYNVMMIQDGQVWMQEADCKDLICVEHDPIKKTGEVIICLPHKVSIEVIGEEPKEYDMQ